MNSSKRIVTRISSCQHTKPEQVINAHGHGMGTTAKAAVLMWPFSCSRVAPIGWCVHGPGGMVGMCPSPPLQHYPCPARCRYLWLLLLQDLPISRWLLVDVANHSTRLLLIWSNVTLVVTMSVVSVARTLVLLLFFDVTSVLTLERSHSSVHIVIFGPHRKEILIVI